MTAEPLGIYRTLEARIERIAANLSPMARHRAFPNLYPMPRPADQSYRITVDCRTGERTVEAVQPNKPKPKPRPPAAPYIPLPTEQKKRKRYANMSDLDKAILRADVPRLLNAVTEVTGYTIDQLKQTHRRCGPITAARRLFFAIMYVSHPSVSVYEMALPLGCDVSIASDSLRHFALKAHLEPLASWISHPVLERIAPRLRLIGATAQ